MFTLDELTIIRTEMRRRMDEDTQLSKFAILHNDRDSENYYSDDFYKCKTIFEKCGEEILNVYNNSKRN